MYKQIKNYHSSDSFITYVLSRSSGVIDWNSEYILSIPRQFDYIHSISGLPPNNLQDIQLETALLFNDDIIPIRPDAKGVYHFLEPLPISLLPLVDIRLLIRADFLKENDPRKMSAYPYIDTTGQFSHSAIPLDKNDVIKINITGSEGSRQMGYKSVDVNAIISSGTIHFNSSYRNNSNVSQTHRNK